MIHISNDTVLLLRLLRKPACEAVVMIIVMLWVLACNNVTVLRFVFVMAVAVALYKPVLQLSGSIALYLHIRKMRKDLTGKRV